MLVRIWLSQVEVTDGDLSLKSRRKHHVFARPQLHTTTKVDAAQISFSSSSERPF